MIIKEAKGFGATIDEAKENAIKNLNASEFDDIQFDVISMPKKKILGIFGGSDAEVRAYIEVPDKKTFDKKTNSKDKNIKNTEKKQAKEVKAPEKAQPKAVEKEAEKAVQERSVKEVPEYGEPVDADKIPADSNAGKAVAYIKTILASLGCENVSIKVASRENGSLIMLDGEDLSVLIGRRGETLDALQYLAGLVANSGGGHYKIAINIGNYRERREETLIALAKRMAKQALETGKCRTLEPMNPYERRIIHTAIQEIEGVESASFGEDANRRVVIAPTGVEMKPRMNGGKRSARRRPERKNRSSSRKSSPSVANLREPRKDSDVPLYGKVN
ncbi:MAG: RNA-binding cell elongation regulator Jag/EloR [Acutalibacteraceae bacterium]